MEDTVLRQRAVAASGPSRTTFVFGEALPEYSIPTSWPAAELLYAIETRNRHARAFELEGCRWRSGPPAHQSSVILLGRLPVILWRVASRQDSAGARDPPLSITTAGGSRRWIRVPVCSPQMRWILRDENGRSDGTENGRRFEPEWLTLACVAVPLSGYASLLAAKQAPRALERTLC